MEKLKMENKGKLIVLEGACDGVGKSTQLKLLKDELKKEVECEQWHFPSYGFGSGIMAVKFLKGKLGELDEIPEEVIESYYAIDREYVWRNYLKKYYAEGKTILLDRYTTSSFIYQTLKCRDEDEKKDMIFIRLVYLCKLVDDIKNIKLDYEEHSEYRLIKSLDDLEEELISPFLIELFEKDL